MNNHPTPHAAPQTLPQTPLPAHFDWMAQTAGISDLRITELILPGSHNAGCDKLAPALSLPQEIAQDVPPCEQLENGIRVLDLRVVFYTQYDAGDPRRFQLYHRTSSGRTVAVDIADKVNQYFRALELHGTPAREIVILDVHQFSQFTPEAHAELAALLNTTLGPRLIPPYREHLNLGQLWRLEPGRNVVIAYNYNLGGSFWNGVVQRWPGETLFNTNTLHAFIQDVAQEHKPDAALHAVQCAKYSLPFHAPSDLSEPVNRWFKSTDADSYIQNFYIINTDWSLRSDLVAQCRHANQVRARFRREHPDQPLQPKLRRVNRG